MWGFNSSNKWPFLQVSMRSRTPQGACMKFIKKIKGFSRGWPFFQKALHVLWKLHTCASRRPRPHRELKKCSFVSWIKASPYDVEGKRIWTRSRERNMPSPHSTGLRPLSGPLPCHQKDIPTKWLYNDWKSRARVLLTIWCLLATGSSSSSSPSSSPPSFWAAAPIGDEVL